MRIDQRLVDEIRHQVTTEGHSLRHVIKTYKEAVAEQVLRDNKGNMERAAKELGMTRGGLRNIVEG